MSTMTLQQVQAQLPDVIAKLRPGEDLIITDNQRPVARLSYAGGVQPRKPRKAGSAKGEITIVSDDEEHLEHFRDYMPSHLVD